jgi:hypothetical protein
MIATVRAAHGLSPAWRPSGAPAAILLDGLTDALRSERRLLDELGAVLGRQVAAVDAEAPEAIDDCTYDAQRVLLTLGEARKRRRTIASWLGVDADLPVPQVVAALGVEAPAALREACTSVERSARTLASRVAHNRDAIRLATAALTLA